jgi:hypothetical protein
MFIFKGSRYFFIYPVFFFAFFFLFFFSGLFFLKSLQTNIIAKEKVEGKVFNDTASYGWT